MDKIKTFINNHKKQIVLSLLLVLFSVGLFFTFNGTLSEVDHREFVYIYSDNTDYYGHEPGAWILYKNAYLLNKDRLRIKYNINSNNLLVEKPKDVLFIIDNAEASLYNYCEPEHGGLLSNIIGLAGQNNESCVLRNTMTAINQLLNVESNLDNRVGIITYNDDYQIRSGFTNDEDLLEEVIYDIQAEGYTDYSKALAAIDDFLEDYEYSNERELKIILYVGNVSKENNLIEKQMFNELKQKYPFIRINALHNVVDNETILEKIRNISDAQYLIQGYKSNNSTPDELNQDINNIMATPLLDEWQINDYGFRNIFSQLIFSKQYTQFKISDVINNEFFNFTDFKVIEKNNGDVSYDNNTLIWTLDRKLLSGGFVYLEVELGVKQNALLTDNLVPVSTSTQIKSIMEGIPDEDINTHVTPYVNFYNKVIYNTSELPESCNVVPIPNEIYKIGEVVNTNLKVANCDGYKFIQWVPNYDKYYYDNYNSNLILGMDNNNKLLIKNPTLLNDDESYYEPNAGKIYANIKELDITNGFFMMPGYDVELLPVFEKVAISKSIETKLTANLRSGENIIKSIVSISGCTNPVTYGFDKCNKVKAFKRSSEEPPNNNYRTISENYSDYPVKMWYDSTDQTIYYYSVAEKIFMNEDSSYMFAKLSELTNIDGLQYLDSSNVKNMSYMFSESSKASDLTPIQNWNTSNVTDMKYMFQQVSSLQNISPLANWDTSSVENMSHLFSSTAVSNVSYLENWDTSKVTNMSYMLSNVSFFMDDISALANWDVSNVENMSGLFSNDRGISDYSPISGWNISKVKSTSYMFAVNDGLTDLTAFENWDVSNVENMSYMFDYCRNLTDISSISGWNTSKVTNMAGLFRLNVLLSDLSPISNWDTSKVTSLASFFSGMKSLTDLSPLSNWDTSNVKNLSYLFSAYRYYTNYSYESPGVTDLSPISNWDTSKVTDFSCMFWGNTVIVNIDPISNWDVSNVEDMVSFMYGATKIESLQNLSNLHFSKVTEFSYIFEGATSLRDVTIVKDFNISSVYSLYRLFYNCSSLTDISALSNWDISNVGELDKTFYGAGIIDYSPISNWNVSNVRRMISVFENSQISNLSPLSNWDVSRVYSYENMFKKATNIVDASPINDWNIKTEGTMYFTGMFNGVGTHPEFTKVTGTWNDQGTFIPGGGQ